VCILFILAIVQGYQLQEIFYLILLNQKFKGFL
jgi:hypothetical protein